MPKQVIRCDCKQGELIELARTQYRPDSSYSESMDSEDITIFYQCTACAKIFAWLDTCPNGSGPGAIPEYSAYDGQLSADTIRRLVPQQYGEFDNKMEAEILDNNEKFLATKRQIDEDQTVFTFDNEANISLPECFAGARVKLTFVD